MLTRCITNFVLKPVFKSRSLICVDCLKPSLFLFTDKTGVRYAGHSHWKNIAKTKATKDALRCKQFNHYIKQMRLAIRDGPADIKLNSKLSKVVKDAQAGNMPLATITRVIQKFELRKKNPIPTWFEYKGANGIIFLIHAATDNRNRTRQDLNMILKKYRIMKAEGVRSAFESKGNILAKPVDGTSDITDRVLEDAIEIGAEEVVVDEESPEFLRFVCESSEVNILKSKLEKRNYTIETAEEIFIPRCPVDLNSEERGILDEVLEKLEEIPEIENVYINLQ